MTYNSSRIMAQDGGQRRMLQGVVHVKNQKRKGKMWYIQKPQLKFPSCLIKAGFYNVILTDLNIDNHISKAL